MTSSIQKFGGIVRGTFLWVLLASTLSGLAQSPVRIELVPPASRGDGSESTGLDGSMNIGSFSLELGQDTDGRSLLTAIRFDDLPVEKGAIIKKAHIQLMSNKVNSEPSTLTIRAELNPVPGRLEYDSGNFSVRQKTVAGVEWDVEPWFLPTRDGIDQLTPNLSEVLQEVVNHPDWTRGSDVVFLIEGSGRRVAASTYNPYRSNPKLTVEFTSPSPLTVAPGGIYINEISSNLNTEADENGEFSDWIELYNSNDFDVSCEGLLLSDKETELDRWALSPQLIIPAGGHLVLWADGSPELGVSHGPFAISSKGETLTLSAVTDGGIQTLDQVIVPALSKVPSYGRQSDGSAEWMAMGRPGPGKPNSALNEYVSTPVVTPETGKYASAVVVEMTGGDSASLIYYTTDGSMPNADSTLYNGPVTIEKSTTIRAIAITDGKADSLPVSRTYIIGEENHLPVVALTIDPRDLFSDEDGIYVKGTNGLAENCDTEPANWNQEWEKPVDITWIEQDGSIGFSISAGAELSGQCTRRQKQKTIQIKTKSRWGDDALNYPLFPDRDQTVYRRFKLRSSGNDWAGTLFRDGFVHDILEKSEMDLEVMGYRPVEVYMNGQFWGIHNVRDSHSKHSINEKFPGVDKGLVDVVKKYEIREDNYSYRVQTGTPDEYLKLYNYLENHSLSDPENWEYIKTQIDFDSAINYHLVEIFVGNHDWPDSNAGLWRENKPFEKWRFLLFDLDDGFGYSDTGKTQPSYNSLRDALDGETDAYPISKESTLMFRRLMEAPEFRHEFAQRMATMMDVILKPEYVLPAIDNVAEHIRPVMERHITFWNSEVEDYINSNYSHLYNELNLGIGNTVDSVSSWEDEVEGYQWYFGARAPEVRRHIQEVLGISGTYRLNITNPTPDFGQVRVNKDRYPAPASYTAIHFTGIPMRIEADPVPGYRFVRWQETGETSAVIDLVAGQDTNLTPVFERDPVNLSDFDGLVISEIQYNPGNTGFYAQEELEYIEFSNLGNRTIDMSGIEIGGAFDSYIVPGGVVISPGGAVVLSRNLQAYKEFRGAELTGKFQLIGPWPGGKLSNSGETITVLARDKQPLFSVTYSDQAPWPAEADGNGASLQLTNLRKFTGSQDITTKTQNLSDPANWAASSTNFGAPGGIDLSGLALPVEIDGDLSEWRLDQRIAEDANDPDEPLNPLDVLEIYFQATTQGYQFGFLNDGPIEPNYSWSFYLNAGAGITTYSAWGIEAEYLIQNTRLFEYAGSGDDWNWRQIGDLVMENRDSVIEMFLPTGLIASSTEWQFLFAGDNAAYGGARVELVPSGGGSLIIPLDIDPVSENFLTPTLDGSLDEWPESTRFYQSSTSGPGQVTGAHTAHDNTNLYFAYGISGSDVPASGNLESIWIDLDNDAATGYPAGGIGCEFLIQDSAIFAYKADGQWEHIAHLQAFSSGQVIEIAIPWTWLGNPESINIALSQRLNGEFRFLNEDTGLSLSIEIPDSDTRPANPSRDNTLGQSTIQRIPILPDVELSSDAAGTLHVSKSNGSPWVQVKVPAGGTLVLETSTNLTSWQTSYTGPGLSGHDQLFSVKTDSESTLFIRQGAN